VTVSIFLVAGGVISTLLIVAIDGAVYSTLLNVAVVVVYAVQFGVLASALRPNVSNVTS